jgi:aminopeptidase
MRQATYAVHDAGALPFVTLRDRSIDRALYRRASAEQFELQARFEAERMKEMDCFIGFTSLRNQAAWSDMPGAQLDLYNGTITKKVHMEIRLPGTRWVVLRYPSAAFAQLAGLSEEAFEDWYFKVCTMDYAGMSKAMDGLVALMARCIRPRFAIR